MSINIIPIWANANKILRKQAAVITFARYEDFDTKKTSLSEIAVAYSWWGEIEAENPSDPRNVSEIRRANRLVRIACISMFSLRTGRIASFDKQFIL